MWVEKLTLENIKCFENCEIVLGTPKKCFKWITFLGENGGGKSTALQALALLLAGPESITHLLNRPNSWLQNETKIGKIGVKIHKGEHDSGKLGKLGSNIYETKTFTYHYWLTGTLPLKIQDTDYNEPTILEEKDNKQLSWLRSNALLPRGKGWFSAGYGAFRRLSRKGGQIIVPKLQSPLRYTNFLTQFEEDEPLSAFETWLVFLKFRILMNGENGKKAQKQYDLGIQVMEALLPEGNKFEKIDENGQIWFNINGISNPIITLSDGYRSILALSGDLVWRLIEAFPESKDPLKEEGIVLIDELDIHLHPIWQRQIAYRLQTVFPNLQFIVATHSPLIAAGAGKDAKTYRFFRDEIGNIQVETIENIAFKEVDQILQGHAFGLASTFSIEAEQTMQEYLKLKDKSDKSKSEKKAFEQLERFTGEMLKKQTNHLSVQDAALQQEMLNYIKKNLTL
jgi:energy-coupling factor transporter ATP-binding protein EcfA2